jgi:hypothetical protein
VAVSAQPPAGPDPAAAADGAKPGGFWGLLLEVGPKVLTTVFGAAGFLGLVAFTGAAVHWARFRALDLPGDEAVAVIPREEQLAAGAVALTGFVVAGVLAVGIAYFIDSAGGPSAQTRLGLVVLAMTGVLVAIALADPARGNEFWATVTVVAAGVLIGVSSIVFAERLPELQPRGAGRRRRRRRPYDRETDNASSLGEAFAHPMEAVGNGLKRSRLAADAPPTADEPPPRMRLTRPGLVLQLAVAIGTGVVLYVCFEKARWVLGSFVVVVLLYISCLSVARGTRDGSPWPGLAVFMAVAFFGALLTVTRALQMKQVQAAAVLLKDESQPICGGYVTEASDRFYLARLDPDGTKGGRTAHMFWVPKSDLVAWKLSALQSRDDARQALPALSGELLADRHERLSTTVETTSSTTGSKRPTPTTKRKESRTPPPPATAGDASCHLMTPREKPAPVSPTPPAAAPATARG